MAVRGIAHELLFYSIYSQSYLPLIIYLFLIDACPGHILESTPWI